MNFTPRLEILEAREVPGQIWSWLLGDDPAPSSLSRTDERFGCGR